MFYTYILASGNNNAVYVGMTNDLSRRVHEHKSELIDGFTKKYHVHKLVYYEIHPTAERAIKREKQLKGWRRSKKNELIESMNPEWKDLYEKND